MVYKAYPNNILQPSIKSDILSRNLVAVDASDKGEDQSFEGVTHNYLKT